MSRTQWKADAAQCTIASVVHTGWQARCLLALTACQRVALQACRPCAGDGGWAQPPSRSACTGAPAAVCPMNCDQGRPHCSAPRHSNGSCGHCPPAGCRLSCRCGTSAPSCCLVDWPRARARSVQGLGTRPPAKPSASHPEAAQPASPPHCYRIWKGRNTVTMADTTFLFTSGKWWGAAAWCEARRWPAHRQPPQPAELGAPRCAGDGRPRAAAAQGGATAARWLARAPWTCVCAAALLINHLLPLTPPLCCRVGQ